MAMIPIDELQPGMVLAGDAVHTTGRTLLRSGVELTEKHIRMFKSWGITSADIAGVDRQSMQADALDEVDPAALEAARAELELRFRNTDMNHPFINELHGLLLKRLATGRS